MNQKENFSLKERRDQRFVDRKEGKSERTRNRRREIRKY